MGTFCFIYILIYISIIMNIIVLILIAQALNFKGILVPMTLEAQALINHLQRQTNSNDRNTCWNAFKRHRLCKSKLCISKKNICNIERIVAAMWSCVFPRLWEMGKVAWRFFSFWNGKISHTCPYIHKPYIHLDPR